MTVASDHQVLVVDGERFEIDYDSAQPGTYHFRWLSGRDPQYGFSVRHSSHERQPQPALIDSIRGFLAQVNTETGYIED